MKKIYYILIFSLLAGVLSSCAKDPVKAYDISDSTVYFSSATNVFSLIGESGDEIELSIPVKLVGPAASYPREISLEIEDSTAVKDVDYRIVSSQIDSGALSGNIVLTVKALPQDVEALYSRFTIVPNSCFPNSFRTNRTSLVGWTASYARPRFEVWRYWFLFFSNGYSKNFHKLLTEELGAEVGSYTGSKSYSTAYPELTFKLPTWWYSASRQFREMVESHDKANPDSPYMHSSDYEHYSSYNTAVGEGTKPDTPPTILETLNVF